MRDSLPVIINFNEDFRGIFFFPNSPVVINGNMNDFEGYVIAKEFVMLKKYHYAGYEYRDDDNHGDFLRYVAAEEKDDVYYERSLLFEGTMIPVSSSNAFAQITINGQTKYVLKSDMITDAADLVTIDGTTYRKDEVGSAEDLAYASGNGKIKYYYTLRKQKNEGWIEQGTVWLDRNKAMTTDINGNPTTDKTKTVLAEFGSNWNYNNSGNDDNDTGQAKGKGVWRVKELLADGTEDGWLDEKEGYIKRFLLKEEGAPESKPPKCIYSTADELLTAMGGYTKINDTQWKKNDAREYKKVTSGGNTYYLPKNVVLFDSNALVPESMEGKVPVKYYDNNNVEKVGFADISGDDVKKYYLMYQDDIQGNDTHLNPMFVDELGNVQYRHKKDGSGNEIATNDDGSVAYETIEPTVDPYEDPALMRQAIDEAVKEMTVALNLNANEDFANGLAEELHLTVADFSDEVAVELGLTPEDFSDAEKKLKYIAKKYPDEYKAAREKYLRDNYNSEDSEISYAVEVKKFFNEKFKVLYEEEIKFFDSTKFGLASSVFDNFQLVWMTEYSYLNKQGDLRSINNLFTIGDAERSD